MGANNEMDRLRATTMIRVPGVTNEALNLELFNTINEFLRRTNAWRYIDDIQLTQGERQYPIAPPSGTALVRVMSVTQNGRAIGTGNQGATGMTQRGRLEASDILSDESAIYDPDAIVTEGGVFDYALYFPTYIAVSIPPSADAATYPLHVDISLMLANEVLGDDCGDWGLPDWMYGTFHEAWIDGLQARLMSQINKPYSNPQMAVYHAKRFRKHMVEERTTTVRGRVYNAAVRPLFPRGGFI